MKKIYLDKLKKQAKNKKIIELAKMYGISISSMCILLNKHGIKTKIKYRTAQRNTQVKEMRAKGLSFKEIGDRLGVSRQRAKQIYDK